MLTMLEDVNPSKPTDDFRHRGKTLDSEHLVVPEAALKSFLTSVPNFT
jgi:hypothetical protein